MIRTTMIWSCSSSSSSSLPFFNAIIKPSPKRNNHQYSLLQVKAQCSRDEGRLNNGIVDANLSVLRERMEEVKMKERLERCCRSSENGWKYSSAGYYKLPKKKNQFGEFLQLVGLVGGTIGFTCFSGTLFLCLLSLILHLN